MCGIVGYVAREPVAAERWAYANKMQFHRGPDAQGTLYVRKFGLYLGFGFQRLAILDLSAAGMQPMRHPDGSVLVFNGEIYNYVELRQDLESRGVRFQGKSDSEVLLHALSHDSDIALTLARLNGMWAFAWLDGRSNTLSLSRDRCGEKPLYYINDHSGFYFASELKTLVQLRGGRFSLNKQTLGEYLEQCLINASTETLFEAIHQVPAAATVRINLSDWPLKTEVRHYWAFPPPKQDGIDESSFIEQTQALFRDSIKIRLRSDVPVGILLSGGIDSSSIAAVASDILGRDANLNLLSSVSNATYDESTFIDIMERHLGNPVTRVRLQSQDVLTLLEKVTVHMDGPVGSLSAVGHYQLMQRAKEYGVTVLLSGQGADEALCGYKKYVGFYAQTLLRSGHLIEAARTLFEFWKNGSVLPQFNVAEAKRYLPKWSVPGRIGLAGPALLESFRPIRLGLYPKESVQERQAEDIAHLSVPALTHYEDRCSMAASREIRLPFLDWRLIELFVSAPMELKIHQGWTKFAFRKAMEPLLPPAIAWRRDKQGFITPQAHWLKTDLKHSILDGYFAPTSLVFTMGFVDRDRLLRAFKRYCAHDGRYNPVYHRELFSVLACEIWLRQNASVIAGA